MEATKTAGEPLYQLLSGMHSSDRAANVAQPLRPERHQGDDHHLIGASPEHPGEDAEKTSGEEHDRRHQPGRDHDEDEHQHQDRQGQFRQGLERAEDSSDDAQHEEMPPTELGVADFLVGINGRTPDPDGVAPPIGSSNH